MDNETDTEYERRSRLTRKKVFTEAQLAAMPADELAKLKAAFAAHDWKTIGLNPQPTSGEWVEVETGPDGNITIRWAAPDEEPTPTAAA